MKKILAQVPYQLKLSLNISNQLYNKDNQMFLIIVNIF